MQFMEHLAKFNPKTCRFDPGFGGDGPVIGRDEVADAVAAIKDPVGAAMVSCNAWPDSRQWYMPTLSTAARAILVDEHDRRKGVYLEAQKAATQVTASGRILPEKTRTRMLEQAKAQLWPDHLRNILVYEKIPGAVITELTHGPTVCQTCSGNRTLSQEQVERITGRVYRSQEGPVTCPTCNGSGIHKLVPRKRGGLIGISRTGYLKMWFGPYEYLHAKLLERMWDACYVAARRIARNRNDADRMVEEEMGPSPFKKRPIVA